MKIYNYISVSDETIMSELKKMSKFSDTAKMFLENDDDKHCLFCYEKNKLIDSGETDFHPKNSGCIKLNDEYMFDIRCDNLIWIEGATEEGDFGTLYFIGNHKGQLRMIAIGLYDISVKLNDLSAFHCNETMPIGIRKKGITINGKKIMPFVVYVVNTCKGKCLVEFEDIRDDFFKSLVGYDEDFEWKDDYLQNLDYDEKSFRVANRKEIELYIQKNNFYHSVIKAFVLTKPYSMPDFCDTNTRRMFSWFIKKSRKADGYKFINDEMIKEFEDFLSKNKTNNDTKEQ